MNSILNKLGSPVNNLFATLLYLSSAQSARKKRRGSAAWCLYDLSQASETDAYSQFLHDGANRHVRVTLEIQREMHACILTCMYVNTPH